MGHARPRPRRLAAKLLQIRQSLGISQSELVRRLGVQKQIPYHHISKYELNKNEPPLGILLAYSRVARIPVENIIDDDLDLYGFMTTGIPVEQIIDNDIDDIEIKPQQGLLLD